jgi:O-acetyl-ADP-ribose deacetylase (regulator of RNase III)
MITYVIDNLFHSPAHVLVNTVNTVGVMGKGIAKEFKTRYPAMFKEYQKQCESKQLIIGKLWVYKTDEKWILNFPTKTTWKRPSELYYIEEGLKTFVREYAQRGITSVAFPPLGCGNGELSWERQVKPLMETYLGTLPIDVFIYFYRPEEQRHVEHLDIPEMNSWLRSSPQTLGLSEVWHDLSLLLSNGSLTLSNQCKVSMCPFKEDEPDSQVLCFTANNLTSYLKSEDFGDFWDLLRNYGLMMRKITPASTSKIYLEIVELMSLLPYCKSVQVGTDYDQLNDSIGLQLAQPEAKEHNNQQLQLLAL